MNNEAALKSRLNAIKENQWQIPQEIDAFALSKELLAHIGSIDPELRDDLILTLLGKIVSRRELTDDQTKEILNASLSEDHLLYSLGKSEDDSVFTRTFSVLVIEEIIRTNNNSEIKFLDADEVRHVYSQALKYFKAEKDVRGYIEVKGWAHSSAHTADLFCSLVVSKVLNHDDLVAILRAIKDKVCIDCTVYINKEDERLVNAVTAVLRTGLVSDEEFAEWVDSFKLVTRSKIYPQDGRLQANIKTFLRSLYFRLKESNSPVIMAAIDQALAKW